MMFPAKWRKQLEQVIHSGLVVNRDIYQKCLVVYPAPEWAKMLALFENLNEFDDEDMAFKRKFLRGASRLELDSVGRLAIPASLLTYMEVDPNGDNEIIACGMGGKIELWSKANHQNDVLEDNEDFKALANKVKSKMAPKPKGND